MRTLEDWIDSTVAPTCAEGKIPCLDEKSCGGIRFGSRRHRKWVLLPTLDEYHPSSALQTQTSAGTLCQSWFLPRQFPFLQSRPTNPPKWLGVANDDAAAVKKGKKERD